MKTSITNIIRYLCAVLMLSGLCAAPVAKAFTVNYSQVYINYVPTSDSTVGVIGIGVLDTSNDIDLQIPEEVEYEGKTYTVTGFHVYNSDDLEHEGLDALIKRYGKIKSITLPSTLKIICKGKINVYGYFVISEWDPTEMHGFVGVKKITIDNAEVEYCSTFEGCTNLEEIDFGNAVIWITGNFENNESLRKISLPKNCIIRDNSFRNCTSLSEINWLTPKNDDGERDSLKGIFENCTSLRSVEFPDNFLIGENMFKGCTGLEEVRFEGHADIDMGAFEGCTSLREVKVKTFTYIHFNAFQGCTALEEIDLSGFTIKEDVWNVGIKNDAFRDCTSLRKVTLNSLCKDVSGASFSGCSNLEEFAVKEIEVPEGEYYITEIDGLLCLAYTEEKVYDEWPFLRRETRYTLCAYPPGRKTKVLDLSSLKLKGYSYPVPSSPGAFAGQCYLEKVTLWANQLYGSSGIFKRCPNLKEVDILPGGVVDKYIDPTNEYTRMTRIPWETFKDCTSLEKVSIPDYFLMIGYHAFEGCTSLKEVKLPESLLHIGIQSFKDCTALEKIELPEDFKEINSAAFSHCSALKEIKLTPKITQINVGAFRNCSSLKEIEIPTGVTLMSNDAFRDCTSLEKVTFNPDVHLEKIGIGAFSGCEALKTLELPEMVDSINEFAFYECSSLKELRLPAKLKHLEQNAFAKCTGAKSVVIGHELSRIPQFAFWSCSGVETLEIGKEVSDIGYDAFGEMNAIRRIICHPTTPPYYPSGFSDEVRENAVLIVPEGAEDEYHNDSTWEPFTTGIDRVEADDMEIAVSADMVTAPDGVRVEIYSLAGQMVASGSGTFEVRLRPGFYIARVGSVARKLHVK